MYNFMTRSISNAIINSVIISVMGGLFVGATLLQLNVDSSNCSELLNVIKLVKSDFCLLKTLKEHMEIRSIINQSAITAITNKFSTISASDAELVIKYYMFRGELSFNGFQIIQEYTSNDLQIVTDSFKEYLNNDLR